MPENILVVEREPRDAALVRQALAGQPFNPSFVREGEEALRALDTTQPKLIVLPSADLIGIIRERPAFRKTPVLVIRQPFSQGDFLGEVQQLLAGKAPGQLTSNDIFGDIFDEDKPNPGARKVTKQSDDLDKLLADTLSDVLPKSKPKTQAGTTPVPSLDKKLQDTLSGLEKTVRAPRPVVAPPPAAPKPAPPAPAAEIGEKTHIAQPVFTPPAPVAQEEEPTDGTKFGQYVLLEKIASGGMAEVWKARMRGVEGFQKIVAIKKILPHLSDNQEFIEMFIDEAKLAAQLNHANIIHIYDLGKIQSSYYIAMEYVDGQDLKTILQKAEQRDQPLPVEVALFITSKIASALDFAHRKEQGLVHRDVSPQNILISEEGDIKLCDFGIAKAASKASHTQAGALKGKLQYMSPEQAWGKAIDRRSDIFALATVLFEMLTRRKLFTGDNEISILEQVREARVTAPSQFNDEVSPEIDAIVLKALRKDPANRYQTAAEMAKDIDALLYKVHPTPTSADLAIYMHRLNAAAPAVQPPPMIEPEPEPVTEVPAPLPAAAAAPAVAMPAWDAPAAPAPVITAFPEKKRSVVPIAIAAIVVVAAIGGFFFMRSRSSAATPAAPVAQKPLTQAPAAAPASATVATASTETLAPSPVTASATTATTATLDPAKVNEEVQRRLAAERAKLEQQSRAQQTAAAPAPQPTTAQRSTPPPVQRAAAPPVQTQPQPQPQPAQTQTVAETRPTPAPQPTQTVAESRPPAAAPAPQPEPARVKEGDLVTDIDTPARMTERANVPYPPMARMERVQGQVLVSALISETGVVLQTRIIRGVSRNVGLNEAAEQIVKRSRFAPAMKDGVRVKAWTTVPIDFKL